MRPRIVVPLFVFVALVGLLAVGLGGNPRLIPVPRLEQYAPQFALPRLHDPSAALASSDLRGRASLLNVWASWCVSCRVEHELLMELSRSREVVIYGLNYKDQRADALRWLEYYGNPFEASAFDSDGRVAVKYGVYGVPETFVIDRRGIIRYKHVGPLDRKVLQESILPMVRRLNEGRA